MFSDHWKILPQVTLKIGGQVVEFLLDTSATSSCLNDEKFICEDCTEGCSIGINGTDIIHKITPLLEVCDLENKVLTKSKFAILPQCPLCLMGRDLMSQLNLHITFTAEGGIIAKSPHCDLQIPKCQDLLCYFMAVPTHLEPHPIWAKSKTDVGHIPCTPYVPTFKPDVTPIFLKQYPLPKEKILGLQPQIEEYLGLGILRPIISPWNTPVNPVRKANGNGGWCKIYGQFTKVSNPCPP